MQDEVIMVGLVVLQMKMRDEEKMNGVEQSCVLHLLYHIGSIAPLVHHFVQIVQ